MYYHISAMLLRRMMTNQRFFVGFPLIFRQTSTEVEASVHGDQISVAWFESLKLT